MDMRVQAGVVKGRGNGGLAVFLNRASCSRSYRVPIPSNRLLGITTCITGCEITLLNVYLPHNSSRDPSALEEYLECLSLFETCYDARPCNLMLVAGDFNADFKRGDPIFADVEEALKGIDVQRALFALFHVLPAHLLFYCLLFFTHFFLRCFFVFFC